MRAAQKMANQKIAQLGVTLGSLIVECKELSEGAFPNGMPNSGSET